MSRRRTSALALKCLSSLAQASSTAPSPQAPLSRAARAARGLGTAAQRTDPHGATDSPAHDPVGFDPRNPAGSIRAAPGNARWDDPDALYRENPNQSVENGVFREDYGDLNRNLGENRWSNFGEFRRRTGGQSAEEVYRANSFQLSAHGSYRETSREAQINPNGNEWRNDMRFHQAPAGHDRGSAGEARQQNFSGIYRENPYQYRPEENSNGTGRSDYGQSYQNPTGNSLGGSSVGAFQKNSNGVSAYNGVAYGEPYRDAHGSHAGFQQDPNGYANNSGRFNQNSYGLNNPQGFYGERLADNQQRPNGNNPEFQQNQNGYYRGNTTEFQQNQVMFQRGTAESFPASSTQAYEQTPGGGLPEASENGSYKGTLEELDNVCKEGKMREIVEVLNLLEKNGIAVGLPRYLCLLQDCGEARCLEEARAIHGHISRALGNIEVGINNKIIDMYSKCGSMTDAYQLFEQMPHRNLTSWDTMIVGLANNGYGEEAIDLFTEFKKKGLKPDGGLFIAVFSACGIVGAVDEGMLHFESMKKDFDIAPGMEHYVSIVDMLGRSGYVDEAFEFVEKMPVEPSVDAWETLMNLCRVNGNVELGDRCAEIVQHLDPSRLTEQAKMGLIPVKASDLEREKQRKKNSNLLEVRSRVHEYRAGDRSHPENDKIYEQIRGLAPQMKEAGYVPETRFVLHDVDQESKEEALLYHSERLAVAYGLMTSAARSPIRIIKNLRVCGDCHNAMKIISKLVGRQLIARDAKRFHHFENGVCSCKDYW